ncbi:MAG: ATP-binding protein [Clostridia bacterium]|nr:ATP-binding protein [Clostridia bacterium]
MERALSQIFADLQRNKLSHAVLLDGGTAELREAAARQAAQAMVCTGSVKPCGVCAHCVKALARSHPDILVYSGGTTVGSFKVDTVREIRRNAGILPNEASVKVFLLLGCETMLAGAQNALLKILEEPPRFVRFVLTCTAASDMLDTIRSRVSVYSLSAAKTQTDDRLQSAADDKAQQILRTVCARDELTLLRETAVFEKDKDLFRETCRSLAALASDVLMQKAANLPADPFSSEIESRISAQQLLRVVQIANDTVLSMQANSNGNLLLAYFCARLFADPNERIS